MEDTILSMEEVKMKTVAISVCTFITLFLLLPIVGMVANTVDWFNRWGWQWNDFGFYCFELCLIILATVLISAVIFAVWAYLYREIEQ